MSDPIQCPPKALNIEYEGATRNRYRARIPVEHTFEDVCNPAYFGMLQASKKLLVGDIIEAEWVDYSRFAELQIRAVEPSINQIVTAVRSVSEYDMPALPDGWTIEFRNQTVGHAILFHGDEKANGFATTDAAARRIAVMMAGAATAVALRNIPTATARTTEAPKNKGGRPPKPKTDADPVKADAAT